MIMPKQGLYAITQTENKTSANIVNDVAAAIKGGACIIQYRDKTSADVLDIAKQLTALCHSHQVPLIINDDVELALAVKADGVHLGKEDGDILQAREKLGPDAIIGVSCYNSIERAQLAQEQGASYVAFGRFFPSGSKPLAAPADIGTLTAAKQCIQLPIVAIGGIMPDNGSQLLEAGADILAVIGGIFDHQPEQSARAFQTLFKN